MIEGTRLHGHDVVRAYWERQFESTDPHVEPTAIAIDDEGRVVVDVYQVLRAKDGTVLDARMVQHAYTFRNGLVARMDVL